MTRPHRVSSGYRIFVMLAGSIEEVGEGEERIDMLHSKYGSEIC